MKRYDFVINFIADMSKLDMAAASATRKVQETQKKIEQATGVSAKAVKPVDVSKAGTVSVKTMDEQIQRGRDLKNANKGLSSTQDQSVDTLNKQAQAYHKGNVAMKEAGRQMGGLKGQYKGMIATMTAQPIGEIIGKVLLWTVATTAIFGTIAAIKGLVGEAIKLESTFADLKRVISSADMDKIIDSTFRLSQGFGAVTEDVAKSAFEWGKTTRIIEDVMAGQTATLLATKVAEMELGNATKYLTAMYHTLGLKGNEIIGIVDMLNEVQNKFGVNIEDMAKALARTSGLMKVYGGNLEQLTGIMGTMLKVTGAQPTRVATAIRTSMMHIRRNAADLKDYGIIVRNTNGSLLSQEEIYNNIIVATQKMDKARKMELLTLIAEGRSYDIWAALLNNSYLALQMQESAANSTGSAIYEYSLIMDTTSERMARMKAIAGELAHALGEVGLTGTIKDAISVFSGFLNILTMMVKRLAEYKKVADEIQKFDFTVPSMGQPKKDPSQKVSYSGDFSMTARAFELYTPEEIIYFKYRVDQLKKIIKQERDNASGRKKYVRTIEEEANVRAKAERDLYQLGFTLDQNRDLNKAIAVAKANELTSEEELLDSMLGRWEEMKKGEKTQKYLDKTLGEIEKGNIDNIEMWKKHKQALIDKGATDEDLVKEEKVFADTIREKANMAEELTEAQAGIADTLDITKLKFAAGLVTREEYLTALRAYIDSFVATNDSKKLAAIATENSVLADKQKEAINMMKVRADLELVSIRDPLEKARQNLEKEKRILGMVTEEIDIIKQKGTIISARQNLESEKYNLVMAQKKLEIAGMIEPLQKESALLFLEQSTLDYISATQGATAALNLEASIIDRSRSLQMSKFELEKRILDMRQELGEITVGQQLEAIKKLAKGVTLTREQSYSLRLELQRLQKESEGQAKESFNLPNIKLPTLYEIRRGLKGGYTQEYYDNRNIVINVSKDVDIALLEEAISRGVDEKVFVSGNATSLRPRLY